MKIVNNFSKSLAVLAAISAIGFAQFAFAHEADCPYCKIPIVQNTATQDNEVVLKFGNKKIEYRCVYCVFKDQKRYKGDLVVYAPSEKVGEPVILKRTAGKWTAPEYAVFLNTFKRHPSCSALSRAFSSKEAFDKYVKDNKVEGAKALSLTEFIAVVTKVVK